MSWKAELESGPEYVEHAGDLIANQMGVDDEGTIWMCIVMSDIGFGAHVQFRTGGVNLGYPHNYHEKGKGPRVRLLKNYKVIVRETTMGG